MPESTRPVRCKGDNCWPGFVWPTSATVRIVPANPDRLSSDNAVYVHTDDPLVACLGAQYAGWPVQTDDFFAMGSGPMRMLRGKEPLLEELGLRETKSEIVGVLESDKPPTDSAIELIAEECGVTPSGVHLAVAPSTSIAGSVQVVARSIETAMHKLHELKFDVRQIVSATGVAPLTAAGETGRHRCRHRTHQRCHPVWRSRDTVGRLSR